ncbi:MAG: hypothetical protein ACRYFS_23450 [Janthinobacterium lividum]
MSDTKTDLKEQSADLEYFAEAIQYFETHDIGDELAASPLVHFEISPQARRKRYPLDTELASKLDGIASQRGISAETLLNEWVREKAEESDAVGAAK